MAVLDFFYIVYQTGDNFGAFLGYVTMSLSYLVAIFVGLCFALKSKFIWAITLGYFADELLNYLIKIGAQEPRPVDSPVSGYGFPSSHAQGSFYLVTIISMVLLINLRKNSFGKLYLEASRPFMKPFKTLNAQNTGDDSTWWIFKLIANYVNVTLCIIIAIALLYAWAVLVAYSRYYLHYHTLEQVILGAAIGFVIGLVWWFVWLEVDIY